MQTSVLLTYVVTMLCDGAPSIFPMHIQFWNTQAHSLKNLGVCSQILKLDMLGKCPLTPPHKIVTTSTGTITFCIPICTGVKN